MFWSTINACRRCIYTLRIIEVNPLTSPTTPQDQDINHTTEHSPGSFPFSRKATIPEEDEPDILTDALMEATESSEAAMALDQVAALLAGSQTVSEIQNAADILAASSSLFEMPETDDEVLDSLSLDANLNSGLDSDGIMDMVDAVVADLNLNAASALGALSEEKDNPETAFDGSPAPVNEATDLAATLEQVANDDEKCGVTSESRTNNNYPTSSSSSTSGEETVSAVDSDSEEAKGPADTSALQVSVSEPQEVPSPDSPLLSPKKTPILKLKKLPLRDHEKSIESEASVSDSSSECSDSEPGVEPTSLSPSSVPQSPTIANISSHSENSKGDESEDVSLPRVSTSPSEKVPAGVSDKEDLGCFPIALDLEDASQNDASSSEISVILNSDSKDLDTEMASLTANTSSLEKKDLADEIVANVTCRNPEEEHNSSPECPERHEEDEDAPEVENTVTAPEEKEPVAETSDLLPQETLILPIDAEEQSIENLRVTAPEEKEPVAETSDLLPQETLILPIDAEEQSIENLREEESIQARQQDIPEVPPNQETFEASEEVETRDNSPVAQDITMSLHSDELVSGTQTDLTSGVSVIYADDKATPATEKLIIQPQSSAGILLEESLPAGQQEEESDSLDTHASEVSSTQQVSEQDVHAEKSIPIDPSMCDTSVQESVNVRGLHDEGGSHEVTTQRNMEDSQPTPAAVGQNQSEQSANMGEPATCDELKVAQMPATEPTGNVECTPAVTEMDATESDENSEIQAPVVSDDKGPKEMLESPSALEGPSDTMHQENLESTCSDKSDDMVEVEGANSSESHPLNVSEQVETNEQCLTHTQLPDTSSDQADDLPDVENISSIPSEPQPSDANEELETKEQSFAENQIPDTSFGQSGDVPNAENVSSFPSEPQPLDVNEEYKTNEQSVTDTQLPDTSSDHAIVEGTISSKTQLLDVGEQVEPNQQSLTHTQPPETSIDQANHLLNVEHVPSLPSEPEPLDVNKELETEEQSFADTQLPDTSSDQAVEEGTISSETQLLDVSEQVESIEKCLTHAQLPETSNDQANDLPNVENIPSLPSEPEPLDVNKELETEEQSFADTQLPDASIDQADDLPNVEYCSSSPSVPQPLDVNEELESKEQSLTDTQRPDMSSNQAEDLQNVENISSADHEVLQETRPAEDIPAGVSDPKASSENAGLNIEQLDKDISSNENVQSSPVSVDHSLDTKELKVAIGTAEVISDDDDDDDGDNGANTWSPPTFDHDSDCQEIRSPKSAATKDQSDMNREQLPSEDNIEQSVPCHPGEVNVSEDCTIVTEGMVSSEPMLPDNEDVSTPTSQIQVNRLAPAVDVHTLEPDEVAGDATNKLSVDITQTDAMSAHDSKDTTVLSPVIDGCRETSDLEINIEQDTLNSKLETSAIPEPLTEQPEPVNEKLAQEESPPDANTKPEASSEQSNAIKAQELQGDHDLDAPEDTAANNELVRLTEELRMQGVSEVDIEKIIANLPQTKTPESGREETGSTRRSSRRLEKRAAEEIRTPSGRLSSDPEHESIFQQLSASLASGGGKTKGSHVAPMDDGEKHSNNLKTPQKGEREPILSAFASRLHSKSPDDKQEEFTKQSDFSKDLLSPQQRKNIFKKLEVPKFADAFKAFIGAKKKPVQNAADKLHKNDIAKTLPNDEQDNASFTSSRVLVQDMKRKRSRSHTDDQPGMVNGDDDACRDSKRRLRHRSSEVHRDDTTAKLDSIDVSPPGRKKYPMRSTSSRLQRIVNFEESFDNEAVGESNIDDEDLPQENDLVQDTPSKMQTRRSKRSSSVSESSNQGQSIESVTIHMLHSDEKEHGDQETFKTEEVVDDSLEKKENTVVKKGRGRPRKSHDTVWSPQSTYEVAEVNHIEAEGPEGMVMRTRRKSSLKMREIIAAEMQGDYSEDSSTEEAPKRGRGRQRKHQTPVQDKSLEKLSHEEETGQSQPQVPLSAGSSKKSEEAAIVEVEECPKKRGRGRPRKNANAEETPSQKMETRKRGRLSESDKTDIVEDIKSDEEQKPKLKRSCTIQNAEKSGAIEVVEDSVIDTRGAKRSRDVLSSTSDEDTKQPISEKQAENRVINISDDDMEVDVEMYSPMKENTRSEERQSHPRKQVMVTRSFPGEKNKPSSKSPEKKCLHKEADIATEGQRLPKVEGERQNAVTSPQSGEPLVDPPKTEAKPDASKAPPSKFVKVTVRVDPETGDISEVFEGSADESMDDNDDVDVVKADANDSPLSVSHSGHVNNNRSSALIGLQEASPLKVSIPSTPSLNLLPSRDGLSDQHRRVGVQQANGGRNRIVIGKDMQTNELIYGDVFKPMVPGVRNPRGPRFRGPTVRKPLQPHRNARTRGPFSRDANILWQGNTATLNAPSQSFRPTAAQGNDQTLGYPSDGRRFATPGVQPISHLSTLGTGQPTTIQSAMSAGTATNQRSMRMTIADIKSQGFQANPQNAFVSTTIVTTQGVQNPISVVTTTSPVTSSAQEHYLSILQKSYQASQLQQATTLASMAQQTMPGFGLQTPSLVSPGVNPFMNPVAPPVMASPTLQTLQTLIQQAGMQSGMGPLNPLLPSAANPTAGYQISSFQPLPGDTTTDASTIAGLLNSLASPTNQPVNAQLSLSLSPPNPSPTGLEHAYSKHSDGTKHRRKSPHQIKVWFDSYGSLKNDDDEDADQDNGLDGLELIPAPSPLKAPLVRMKNPTNVPRVRVKNPTFGSNETKSKPALKLKKKHSRDPNNPLLDWKQHNASDFFAGMDGLN